MNFKKIAIIGGAVVLLAAIVGFTVQQSRKNVVAVQTSKVQPQDVTSTVTASGEIKPKTYVNIGANAFGKIVKLYVREGDRVKAGQVLAQIENVQPSADVAANRAQLEASRTDAIAMAAGLKTAQADLERARADQERTRLDYQRAEKLFGEGLIPKSDYDTRKAAYLSADAALAQAQARVAQSKAQKEATEQRISQYRATLTRASDALSKTLYTAPFDGVVTNLPVREGETVVIGIQNAPGSTLMTLSDMGVITAEVRVDETDVVNVKLGQPAEVTIDAIPHKVFKGKVSEIGDVAVVRSTGVATSQTLASSQEAKDFKVTITLQDPPTNIRPGLSATAKITTDHRESVLAIPIQALTMRKKSDLEPKTAAKSSVQAAAPAEKKKQEEEIQGVFVIRERKAEFRPVSTGITGTTEIEVTNGLKAGEEIITGSYRVLRTLKPGAGVKVDNTVVEKKDEKS